MKNFVLFLFLVVSVSNAQTVEDLFKQANNLYKSEQYEKAINLYKEIENKQQISADVYYNLGNCYYKLNQVGPAIYYYEKALQLRPDYKDVKNNLVFAKRLALDNIEPLPKTLWQKFNENYLQQFTYNQWSVIVVIFSFVASIFFLLYYYSYSSGRKRVFFITSMLSFLLLILSLLIAYNQYNITKNTTEAIVFSAESEIRNAPTFNSEKVFTLHEGTKVQVLDTVDDWKKIQIADGKQGWVIASEVKEL